jgi:hypothetical protein
MIIDADLEVALIPGQLTTVGRTALGAGWDESEHAERPAALAMITTALTPAHEHFMAPPYV